MLESKNCDRAHKLPARKIRLLLPNLGSYDYLLYIDFDVVIPDAVLLEATATCDKGMSAGIAIIARDAKAAKQPPPKNLVCRMRRLYPPVGFAGQIDLRQGKARLQGAA